MAARFIRIGIQGAIGAGKSTLLRQIACCPHCVCVAEPVKLWRDDGGFNMLGEFYKDPANNFPYFQIYAMQTRLDAIKRVPIPEDTRYVFLDRTPEADKLFFNVNAELYGCSDMATYTYALLYKRYLDTKTPIEAQVFLETSIDVCMERMQKRERLEEARLETMRSYNKALIDEHARWRASQEGPKLVINGDCDFEHDPNMTLAKRVVAWADAVFM